MNILIVSGGSIDDAFALEFIKRNSFEYIIAVDKGTAFAQRAGITPSILTGDFDTLDHAILHEYEDAGLPVRRFKPEKDAADIEIALNLARDKVDEWRSEADAGTRSGEGSGNGQNDSMIWILGGTGTRLDHVIGTIYAMAGLGSSYDVRLIDPNNLVRILWPGETVFARDEQYGKYISFLPIGGSARGVTMIGMKYPLMDAVLTPANTLGVSNEIIEERASIRFERGVLACIQSRD